MSEVQLHLLEGPFHEKAGEGVHDRPHSGERQARARPDQQLLADTDVDHPVGMRAPRLLETVRADHGENDRDPRILVEQPRGDGNETVTHGVHGVRALLLSSEGA